MKIFSVFIPVFLFSLIKNKICDGKACSCTCNCEPNIDVNKRVHTDERVPTVLQPTITPPTRSPRTSPPTRLTRPMSTPPSAMTSSPSPTTLSTPSTPSTPTSPIDYATCSIWGDPHYTVFDGTRFDFQGNCTYVLSRYCDQPSSESAYSVEVTHGLTKPTSTVSETKSFTFKLPGITIELEKNHVVKVNSSPILMPYSSTNVQISVNGSTVSLTVQTPPILFSWTSNHYGVLQIEKDSSKSTCGLCKYYQAGPLIKQDGTTTTSEIEFGNSWKVSPNQVCNDDVGSRPCDFTPPFMVQSAGALCSVGRDSLLQSNLSTCVREQFLDTIIDQCVSTLCDCGIIQRCLCKTLEAIVYECDRLEYPPHQSFLNDFNCNADCYRDGTAYSDGTTFIYEGALCRCEAGTISCQ